MILSLERVYGEYLEAKRASQAGTISSEYFVTDMNACPRKKVLEWRGAPRREENPLWKWETLRKFDDANHSHDTMAEALEHSGALIKTELRLSDYLPGSCGGRLDHIFDPTKLGIDAPPAIIEQKDPDPRIKPENTPKLGDIEQVMIYQHVVLTNPEVLPEEWKHTMFGDPFLLYVPAAGGGSMLLYQVPYPEFIEGALAKLSALLTLWESHKDPKWTPDPLPRMVAWDGRNKVVLGPDWRCTKKYCPFAWSSSCTPQSESTIIGERPRKKPGGQVEEMKPKSPIYTLDLSVFLATEARWQIKRAEMYVESGFEAWREEENSDG